MNTETSAADIVAQITSEKVGSPMLSDLQVTQIEYALPTVLYVDGVGYPLTAWQPGTNTPAHDGMYEVVDPTTGTIDIAEYDTLFESWSCATQYPTWRGLAVQP